MQSPEGIEQSLREKGDNSFHKDVFAQHELSEAVNVGSRPQSCIVSSGMI